MSTRLPSLYRRGTDVFGCRKTPPPYNKINGTFTTSLPPIPSVNDLLVIGRDEIESMKDLKDSLKCIKKLNNSSRIQRHKVKQYKTITSKDIEMLLDSEQEFFNDYDTENDEERVEREQQGHAEDENDFDSDNDNDNPSFEEEEDSDPGLSDFISLTDGDFISDEAIEQNEAEPNQNRNTIDENTNDSQIPSSTSQDSNDFSFVTNNLNAFDLLQQTSLEDESNIHQVDDALSFVSSIVCNNSNLTNSTSTSTSNSSLNSPSVSNSNSRSNSALVTPRNQSSRNNSARSTHSTINQQITSTNHENSENADQISNAASPRLNSNVHYRFILSRPNIRTLEYNPNRTNTSNTSNLRNLIANLDL